MTTITFSPRVPDAVLLAPDRSTPSRLSELLRRIKTSFTGMSGGAVLEIPTAGDDERLAVAEWCLHSGIPVRNPFARPGTSSLLVERPII